MGKRRYQSRKVKTKQLFRFRGVFAKDSKHNVPDQYVGEEINLVSRRIGSNDLRTGHTLDTVVTDGSYNGAITSGNREISFSSVTADTDWYASIRLGSARLTVKGYVPPLDPDPPVWPPLPEPPPDPPFPPWNPPDGEGEPDRPPFPPLPEPLNPDFSLVQQPENFKMFAVEGYGAGTVQQEVSVTFDNIDGWTTLPEVEANVTAYFDSTRLVDSGTSFEINGDQMTVTKTFDLVEGLTPQEASLGIFMSPKYNYGFTLGKLTIQEQTVITPFPWQALWNTLDQRKRIVQDAPYLPAFETYDFDDPATQVNFILSAQQFCEEPYSGSAYKFISTNDNVQIELGNFHEGAGSAYLNDAGLTSGWRRGAGFGNIQIGDEVDFYHFDDLDSVFQLLSREFTFGRQELRAGGLHEFWNNFGGTGWTYISDETAPSGNGSLPMFYFYIGGANANTNWFLNNLRHDTQSVWGGATVTDIDLYVRGSGTVLNDLNPAFNHGYSIPPNDGNQYARRFINGGSTLPLDYTIEVDYRDYYPTNNDIDTSCQAWVLTTFDPSTLYQVY